MEPLLRRLSDAAVRKISSDDTNKFALLADPITDAVPFTAVIEIFDVGGKTPPNTHATAYEMFYVLRGVGLARCGNTEFSVSAGDAFVVPPGHEHLVENTGAERLYCLTVMIPNEEFAELIHKGEVDVLDGQDYSALTNS